MFWSMALLMAAGTFVPAQRAHAQSPENRFAGAGVSEGPEEMLWSSPGNITADDGARAFIDGYDSDEFERTLRSHTYGFTIPGGATIEGIELIVERRNDSGSGVRDDVIRLAKAGTAVGTNKSTAVIWPSSYTTITYGSPTDLWGTTWTPAEINAAGFGATLNPLNTGNAENAHVDYHRILVYYTVPGGATLLARYWMEEASSGQGPTQLLDDQASPFNLPITYDGANYSYTAPATGRGWTSTTTNNQGRATALVNGTKIQTTLDGATAATLEIVVAIDALNSNWSRLIHIGDGSESGYLTLSSPNTGQLDFNSHGATLRGTWNPGFDGTRAVFHLVYDSSEPTAGDRVRLYKNGTLLTRTAGTDPTLNETLSVPNGKYFPIANREVCCRSFDGAIYYAAVYDGALSASEASSKSTALLALDDSSADVVVPDAVTDLATGTVRSTSLQLSWTAPGDDGATGTATSYDVRYSTSTITEGNWASATQATGEPSPQVGGSGETFTVTGLSGSTTYYFAIKTSDEVPNEAAISNVPSATTDMEGNTQTGFAWSDDVSTFTSHGDDVTLDAAQGTTYILGIQIAMTAGAANDWVLQVREDGAGSWLDVFALGGGDSQMWETDNTHTFSKSNANTVNTGEFGNTTAPSYFTAVNGEFSDDNNGLNRTFSGTDEYSELQYAVRAAGSIAGHTYEFRVVLEGVPLDAYDIYATVADPGAPDAVADLATGTLTPSSVDLTWTAPGDNGATGTATTYDVRYSTSTITAGNWATATQATGEPAPQVGGSAESFTVTGLSASTTYFFAIKTSDEVPNESGLSNVPSATTLQNPPTVAAAIPDTTVIGDSSPVNNYRDLKAVFTDIEDGSALTYTIQANTNPGLVAPAINPADSTLDLSFTAGINGSATITIRATDSGAAFVDDIFTVTVTDTHPPDAVADLATGTVTASSVDLSWTSPGDDAATGTATTYDVRYSTSVINDGNWASATQATGEPSPQAAGNGEAFTVTGLNSSTTYYFAIKTSDEVPNESAISNVPSGTTLNGAPTVAAAIADTTVVEDSPPIVNYRDLKAVFTDFEDGSALTYTIQANTNPGLVTPAINPADSTLDLSFTASMNGTATITIRATDSGALFVDDVFTITVPDSSPPDAVTDLGTGSVSSSSVQLTWTAPGDDGATGTATSYDVRYSTSTITEGNWAAATQASGEPSPQAAGGGESFTVTGLSQGTTYHFAIKTSDEVPNQSAISNVPNVATIVSASVSYQKGDGKGSVSEIDDAKFNDGGSANNNYGSTTDLEIDSGDKHSVIKFPNIFGGGADQIPLGSVIISATLTLELFNPGDDPLVYQLIEGWVESQATYNDRTTGVAWSDPGAGGTGSHKASADGSLPAGSSGTQSVDVTTSVQNWSDGEVNEGWVLEDTGSDGVDIRSSEYATVADRPMLSVTYVPGGDQTAPNTVTDLATGTLTESSVQLTWTAPGDDGATGTATSYDIRYSTSPITAGNWATATQASGEPAPQVGGSGESFTVTGLSPTTLYYFAIKTSDEIPNVSVISNVPSASTTADITAPNAVADLATGTVTVSTIDLSWTAPGDDGATGTATTYDVRYSTAVINAGNWASATQATGEPAPLVAGSAEAFTVTGLSASTTYFFAIKTSDEIPNESALSNVPSGTTTCTTATLPFTDDFNRGTTGTVGNCWVEEAEGGSADATINTDRLQMDSNNDANSPRVSHTFTQVSTGFLKWTYVFNWDNSGGEGTYEMWMQLGNSATMVDPATSDNTGVAVNLKWGSPNRGLTNDEGLAYVQGAVVTEVAVVSGGPSGDRTIEVIADLDLNTFKLKVDGITQASGIAFDNNVNIDAVRIYTDELSDSNFGNREFDDMTIEVVDYTPGFSSGGQKLHVGQPPVPIRTMTITDASAEGTFTTANDLRIRIPATFNMIWDTLDVDATIGGGASAKVSPTVSYEDAGKTLVLTVLTDFLALEQFTVADLSFMSFTAVSAADKLELEVYNDDVVTAEDSSNKEIIVGPSISSRTNQIFSVSAPPTLADTITITESPTDPVITAGDDIRIRIPTGFNMVWDATVTSVTLGGGAAGNVSTTLLPYEDGNKTAVLDVTGNFAVSDVITVVGLTFTTFSGVSAADSLELELENDGVVSAEDDKTIEIVTDATPPDAVADLATGTVTTSSVDLSWTAPGDDGATGTATTYDVRYSTSTITAGNWATATQATGEPAPSVAGSAETFTVTGLSESTTYFFAIKTSDEVSNESALSNVPSATTADGTAPNAVADLATGTVTTSSVALSWTAPGDDGATGTATTYDVRYSTSTITAGNWATATRATGEPSPQVAGSAETFTVTGLSESTTYFFAIKTSDEVPNESALSNVPSATTADGTAPDAVADLATGTVTTSSVDLSWTAPGDDGATGTATTYDVRYSTSTITAGNWATATQASGEPSPQVAGSAETFTVTGLSESTTYYFAIKTSDEVPNESALSNVPSAATADGTAPDAVTDLATGTVTTSSVALSWTAPGDDGATGTATTYDVRYSTSTITAGNWATATQATGEPSPQVAGSGETFTVTGLSESTTYYFAIKTSDEVPNESALSNVPSATTADGTAPDAVADLATGTVTTSSVDLSWTAPGDDGATGTATTYDVRYSTSTITAGNWATATQATGEPSPQVAGSAETFTVTGLSESTTYFFAIKTSDEVPNESALSNVPSAATADGTAPNAVADLATGTVTTSSVVLSWTAPGDDGATGTATSYDVRYSTSTITAGNWATATQATGEPAPSVAGSAETFTVTGLSESTTYFFAIKTSDEVPNESALSNVPSATTADGTAPNAVADLATGTVTTSSVALSWTAPGDDGATGTATTYDVRYSTSTITAGNWATATQASGEPSPQVAGSAETFTVTGLSESTTYFFAIKTSDEVPNESALSNVPSATTADGTAPNAVADLATGTVTTSSVALSWTAPGDDGATGTATTYDVRYSTSTITAGNWASATLATGEPAPSVAGSAETFTVTGLSESTTYFFAIKTSDEVPNESALSNVPSATTATTAPAAVTDFATGTVTASSVALSWTAPGDDGATGTATTYDVRYSTSTITAGNWASATQATGEPAPSVAGSAETFTVTGLSVSTTYFFAIKTSDEVPNESALSNVPSATTTSTTYAVAVTPDTTTASRLPSNGTNYTVDFTVVNGGTATDDFDLLTTQSPGTAITVVSITGTGVTQGADPDSARVSGLASSGAAIVTVTYSVGDVVAGTADTLFFSARSVGNSATIDDGRLELTVIRPNLTTGKAVSPSGTLLPGTELTYTVTITNDGSQDATGVVVVDSVAVELDFKVGSVVNNLPAGVTATVEYSNDAGSSWTYTPVSAGCSAPANFDSCVTHIRWTLDNDLSYVGPDNTGNVEFVARIQ